MECGCPCGSAFKWHAFARVNDGKPVISKMERAPTPVICGGIRDIICELTIKLRDIPDAAAAAACSFGSEIAHAGAHDPQEIANLAAKQLGLWN